MEVIEISSDVSFILILPSAQKVCSVPGEADETNQKYLMLPVQAFEMSKHICEISLEQPIILGMGFSLAQARHGADHFEPQ